MRDTPTTASYVDGRILVVNSQFIAERAGVEAKLPYVVSALMPPG